MVCGLMVWLVLWAGNGMGQDVCLFRPETIEAGKVEKVLVLSRSGGLTFPRFVFAEPLLASTRRGTGSEERWERASVAIQYSLEVRRDYLPLNFRLQAWVDEAGVPPWTLQQTLNYWLRSGNRQQREEAGELLWRVISSSENDRCNGGGR